MKAARWGGSETTAAFQAYCTPAAKRPLCLIDLYDITLAGLGYPTKLVLRHASSEYDVPFESVVYAGGTHIDPDGTARPGLRLVRGQIRTVLGLEVDELELSCLLDGTDSLPPADGDAATPRIGVHEAVAMGLFDGAHVRLRRLYLPAPPVYPLSSTSIANRGDLGPGDTSLGAVTLFAGFITEASVSRSKASFKVRSLVEKAQIQLPRNVYQAGCRWQLGDLMCGVDLAGPDPNDDAYRATAAIATLNAPASRAILIVTTTYPTDTALPYATEYFTLGTVQFTSGALAGLSRTIEQHPFHGISLSRLDLLSPLPRLPAVGDEVLVQKGCRRTLDACDEDFDNFFGARLPGDITSGVTTITVDTTVYCPALGRVRIEAEIVSYTGKTATTLTGCTRGASGTTAVAHVAGHNVIPITALTFGGTTVDYALNGLRFGGYPSVPPPDSAV